MPSLRTTLYYTSTLVSLWIMVPWLAVLQALAVIVVWTHASIGIYFWLRPKRWFNMALPFLRPVAMLLPAAALAGYVSAGNQVLMLQEDDPIRRDVAARHQLDRREPRRAGQDRACGDRRAYLPRDAAVCPARSGPPFIAAASRRC